MSAIAKVSRFIILETIARNERLNRSTPKRNLTRTHFPQVSRWVFQGVQECLETSGLEVGRLVNDLLEHFRRKYDVIGRYVC